MSPESSFVILKGMMVVGLMVWAAMVPVWLCTDPVPGRPWKRMWWDGE